MNLRCRCCLLVLMLSAWVPSWSETLRHPESLAQQLEQVAPQYLADEARRRGDPRRGALVFFKSAAACVHCHDADQQANPLGPDLAKLGEITDLHVIESLLHPAKSIRKGYETYQVLTADGRVLTGLLARQDDDQVVLRLATDLTQDTVIDRDDIDMMRRTDQSLMPDGLVASLADQRDFLDLAAYVIEVAGGGTKRASALRPSPEQLAVKDDSVNLDHAGIIKRLGSRDFEAGRGIYHGYCFNCHGSDGNTPSLPTARAFGSQKLKFGSDPYRMFMTLTRGNGLMAPMSHLTPKERYQVVHYIRQQFMEGSNPDFFKVNKDYLSGLPEGTENGTRIKNVERDFGPALASQLNRNYSSVLTIQTGPLTVSYDLHSMDQAGVWQEGFLDLSNTQHVRGRGEGTANPDGTLLPGLSGWAWGHEGTLDYSRDGLLPRGPIPSTWMEYHGYYLHGDQLALHYAIDGREILDLPQSLDPAESFSRGGDRSHRGLIRHSLRIKPGDELLLCAASAPGPNRTPRMLPVDAKRTPATGTPATGTSATGTSATGNAANWIAASINTDPGSQAGFTAAGVIGDAAGMVWEIDPQQRICLRIPADDKPRDVEVVCFTSANQRDLGAFGKYIAAKQREPALMDFAALTGGGPQRWPEVLTTTGYLGLEQGAYALDTITTPDSTPWNTWFRTSALDFFPDGRMVLATYGGDIWMVSGIDDQLLELKWKRFAGGLYEPFGVKVVDGHVYVTCKDRLMRLHDFDGNGEADYYESFSADQDVSVNFHAFNFDLQTDREGNFYYAKSGHGADTDLPGAVFKVSSDGSKREVYCTGFRTPNGMGSLPDGRVTASDNQGQWTPASKVSLLKPGGFYGWVQTYSIAGKWEPGGGTIDIDKVQPPESFDPPLVWMPQEFDNSSGGQIWVGDERFGPLSGRLFHTSFGKGWLYYMMIQDLPQTSQAAIIKLPLNFRTGIMRGRVNPADGQVYVTGLQGWNGGGRAGLLDSGVQRVRYTGGAHKMVSDCQVESDGLRLQFNFPLDPDSATELDCYDVTQWNYHWRREYGSDQYSPTTDKPGIEKMNIVSASLGADGKSVKLIVPDIQPVNQVHIVLKVASNRGEPFAEEIYWTINQVPQQP